MDRPAEGKSLWAGHSDLCVSSIMFEVLEETSKHLLPPRVHRLCPQDHASPYPYPRVFRQHLGCFRAEHRGSTMGPGS